MRSRAEKKNRISGDFDGDRIFLWAHFGKNLGSIAFSAIAFFDGSGRNFRVLEVVAFTAIAFFEDSGSGRISFDRKKVMRSTHDLRKKNPD